MSFGRAVFAIGPWVLLIAWIVYGVLHDPVPDEWEPEPDAVDPVAWLDWAYEVLPAWDPETGEWHEVTL